ncbi:MAG: hypothetical protein NZ898_06175 [Myxococcota bacterium]|nr:hypothetical protein [Myxococcota bacterium]
MRRGNASSVRWPVTIGVAAAAAAIVAYKELRAPSEAPASGPRAPADRQQVREGAVRVLLFADPDEADAPCGCGQIVRLVRGAGARGLPVHLIAPGHAPDLERQHRVRLVPTVLFVDARDRVLARHEGEGPETIEAIRAELERLAAVRP